MYEDVLGLIGLFNYGTAMAFFVTQLIIACIAALRT